MDFRKLAGMKGKAVIGVCLLGAWTVLGRPGGQEEDPMRAALRARMALLRLHTAISSDRTISVSGPQASANAYLLEAVQLQRTAMEALLRLPLPFHGQRIRLQVLPPAREELDDDQEVLLRTEFVLGDLTHRLMLPNYESAFSPTAREALIYALLSVYVVDAGRGNTVPFLPPWFWQGVMHVLHPDDVKITLDYLDVLWRSGRVPPLAQFLRDAQEDRLEAEDAIFAGALVHWLASRPSHERIMPQLLTAFARQEPIDVDWLRARLGADPDEQFDRWILAQRRIVRGVGTVLPSHVEQLQEAILLYPGQHGIPRSAAVPWGAQLHTLVAYRDRTWFQEAVQQRRSSLQLLLQGRPARFQEIVDAFIAVLDGVARGEDPAILEEQELLAGLTLQLLVRELEASGGIWREEN